MDTIKENYEILYSREDIYRINQEYDRLRDEMMKEPESWNRKKCQYTQKKFHSYMKNLRCVCSEFSREYAHRMSREFCRAKELDELSIDYFSQEEWDCITLLCGDWYAFYCKYYFIGYREKELEDKLRYTENELRQCRKKIGIQAKEIESLENSREMQTGKKVLVIPKLIEKCIRKFTERQDD